MSKTRNNSLIESWYHDMWNTWNHEIIPMICNENISFRGSLGKENHGFDGISNYIHYIQSAFPDFHNEIELIITEGDKSFAKLKYSGTHKGDIFGIPSTGKKIVYYGSAIFSFSENKISDVWVLGDIHGLLNQLNQN